METTTTQRGARGALNALRCLAEICALAAYLFLVPPLFEKAVAEFGLKAEGLAQVVGTSVLYLGFLLLAALLVKLRGQSFTELGLKFPGNVRQSVLQGILVAAAFFVLVEVLKRTGVMTSDWSSAPQWSGNIALLAAWILMITLLTGVIEEFIYRGFIMDRVASAFGGSTLAWPIALVVQAVLFALAHAYGNTELMLFAGAFALAYGLLYIRTRSLLAPIVAHVAYDVSRVVYFYYLATYSGVPSS